MFLNRLLIGSTGLVLGAGTALAQDMPALVLDGSPGPSIPVSAHILAVLAISGAWLVMLWIVGALSSRQDASAE
jgi:hypothetical protein